MHVLYAAVMQSTYQTSERGTGLIRDFETFAPRMYYCPANKPTIGFGHVIRANEQHLRNAMLTLDQAVKLLQADLSTVEIYLNSVLPDWIRQYHFDALASLVFNIGVGNFDQSTLLKLIKANDRPAAEAEFGRWIFSKGVRLRGLVIRRACERLMFAGCTDNTIANERARLQAMKGPL